MLTLNFDTFPVLTTERLLLRKLRVADAPEILHERSDPALIEFLDRAPCASIDEATSFIRMVNDNIDTNTSINWGITLKDEDRIIGTIAIWRIDKVNHRGEIGYVLHSAHQGKGIMSEALAAVLNYGFHTLRLHSVEANINPANEASRKLLERNGFVQEAYFRENYYYDGRFTDSAIFSLLTPLR